MPDSSNLNEVQAIMSSHAFKLNWKKKKGSSLHRQLGNIDQTNFYLC